MKRIICRWHSDAGHAWLSVPRDLLTKLGIADQISRYSYARGKRVYLEEDLDAALFLRVASLEPIEIREGKHARTRSRVRYYPRYYPGTFDQMVEIGLHARKGAL